MVMDCCMLFREKCDEILERASSSPFGYGGFSIKIRNFYYQYTDTTK